MLHRIRTRESGWPSWRASPAAKPKSLCDAVAGEDAAFALQCMSTIAVVRRETGGWKWPIAQFTYMLLLAYAGSFVTFHVVNWLT